MTGHARNGFSLLELSLVMAIISVILVFGLDIATTATRGGDRTTTQERLRGIQQALDNYVKVNGYLPCPASRAVAPSASGFGVEARNTGTYVDCVTSGTGLVRAPAAGTPFAYIGAVPVRTLGLPDAYAADAWNHKFTYAVSATHVGVAGAYFTTDGPLIIRAGDRTGTNYELTTVREEDGTNASGAAAVYAVISHGADGKGSFPLYGTAGTTCTVNNNNDYENCDDANITFYDSLFNDGEVVANYFDDYIVWRSNALDRIPTSNGGTGPGCTGSCELWCVRCDTTYPPLTSPYVVCKRTITSTSPCKALCEYAYPTNNSFCS